MALSLATMRSEPRSPAPPPESLEALFSEHHGTIYRAAYRVTGSSADAEDVLQTVFLRLLRREETVDLGRGASAYLRRAAVNAALDLCRSRRRQRSTALDDVDPTALEDTQADPERAHRSREARGLVREALSELPTRTAEIFALRYFEGLGNKEIAHLMRTTQTAIAVTLHRTRAKLRDELGALVGG